MPAARFLVAVLSATLLATAATGCGSTACDGDKSCMPGTCPGSTVAYSICVSMNTSCAVVSYVRADGTVAATCDAAASDYDACTMSGPAHACP